MPVLTYGSGTQNEIRPDWSRIQRGYKKIRDAHRSWDRLDCQMLMGAAYLGDFAALRSCYSGLNHGYDPKIVPAPLMSGLALKLHLPAVSPERTELH